ncbi:MAG: sugar-binding transcriptional regulator [SAR324 cluster bacterium]|uniref:Sugar-binding transcriptional regulator n=1 Tax=SAR324 cluster bacterium TaxID=2024889 RepID=A0A7X9IL20_9DELT|nr:sugar-binding transcriptional regulator [SAR324 cluster bacterium]
MFPIDEERVKLIIKICNLYYFDELTQQQISERLGISRPHVSRMLTLAKNEGIVNISIKNPYSEEQKFEKKMVDQFDIVDAVIVDTYNLSPMNSIKMVTTGVTALLKRFLHNGDIIGVAAGNTMNVVSENLGVIDRDDLAVVPLIGGIGPDGATWQANRIVRNLAECLNCNYYQLNAPAFVSTKAAFDVFMAEPGIKDVCDVALNAKIALVGIGTLKEYATIIRSGLLKESDIQELHAKGAIASICNSFVDANGHCVDFSGNDRMIGATINQVQDIPEIIAVAVGVDKVDAITSVLIGGWIDYLVTNLETAKAVLRQAGVPDHLSSRTEESHLKEK